MCKKGESQCTVLCLTAQGVYGVQIPTHPEFFKILIYFNCSMVRLLLLHCLCFQFDKCDLLMDETKLRLNGDKTCKSLSVESGIV